MDVYGILKIISDGALMILFITIVLAVIDHFYFGEAYRGTISIVGMGALSVFFIGIASAVIKGATDKGSKS